MTAGDLQALLSASIARHGVPGAAVAIYHDGRLVEAAAGVANLNTGVPCQTDTIWPFGSVTKVVTATAALALVQAGRLELDAPAVVYAPDFTPRDERLRRVTVRQLLTHTSGLISTIFQDTGRNPDALARQIELINPHPATAEPGALLNYCNSGVLLLGRILEHVTGKTWDEAVRDSVLGLLGADHVVTTPEAALRLRHATGHVMAPGAVDWSVDPRPFVLPGHGPAGSTMHGRPRDLVDVARAYMDGAPVLDAQTANDAWRVHAPSPGSDGRRGWGLGWTIFDWQGRRIVGHNGATPGAKAFLRASPEDRFAIALLTNAPIGALVYEDVVGAVCRERIGVFEATRDDLPPTESLPYDCVGVYEDTAARLEVRIEADQARLRIWVDRSNLLHREPAFDYAITPATRDSFYLSGAAATFYPPGGERTSRLLAPYRLLQMGGPSAGDYLITGSTAHRRVETP